MILDSPVSAPGPEIDAARQGKIFGPLKVYPDRETALGRFRTVPEQDHYLDYVMDHVGRHSLREVEGRALPGRARAGHHQPLLLLTALRTLLADWDHSSPLTR